MGGGRDISDAPWPTAYGFDESFTTFEGLGPRVLVADEERFLADMSGKLGQGPTFYERKSNLTQLFASKTLDFVSRQKGRPWFVQLWLNDVHDPWAPDDAQFAQVKGKGANGDDDRYLASLAAMDRTLGNLFERLKDGGATRKHADYRHVGQWALGASALLPERRERSGQRPEPAWPQG